MRRLLTVLLLAASLAANAAAAGRPRRSIRGRSVVVLGQQSPGTLRRIAVQIEQFRSVLGHFVTGTRQPSLPTQVYIFDDYEAMRPFVPLYQGKPASLGGYCHCGSADDLSFIVAALSRYSESSSLIFHEYAHLLVRHSVPGVPVWLNEGIAEYFSTFELGSNGREAQIGRPIPPHVLLLREQSIPVSQLIAVDRSSPMYNEGSRRSIFYAESWALTHYLLVARPNGAATINKYLAAVGTDVPNEQAFLDAVGVSPKDMDAELIRYLRQPVLHFLRYPLSDAVEVDEPERAQTIAAAEAEARLGDIQMRIGRVEEATPRIEAAAAGGSDVAQAQLTLALLRLRQQRDADAWGPLQKAAALAPDDFLAQYLYGLTLLRGGDSASAQLAPVGRTELARDALKRATAINPLSASAFAWLGFADLVTGSDLQEARSATIRAMALAPGRLDYRLQLAEIDLHLLNDVEGRRLLAELARLSDPVGDQARAILTRLDDRKVVTDDRSRPALSRSISVGPPDDQVREHDVTNERTVFQLRNVGPGEQRVFGELREIGCSPSAVWFAVRAGSRDIVATAARMEDVELIAFGNNEPLTIACGAHVPPDKVYLTWNATLNAQNAAGSVGTAVAVELMPKDYIP